MRIPPVAHCRKFCLQTRRAEHLQGPLHPLKLVLLKRMLALN
jgi:hypothetical protein